MENITIETNGKDYWLDMTYCCVSQKFISKEMAILALENFNKNFHSGMSEYNSSVKAGIKWLSGTLQEYQNEN